MAEETAHSSSQVLLVLYSRHFFRDLDSVAATLRVQTGVAGASFAAKNPGQSCTSPIRHRARGPEMSLATQSETNGTRRQLSLLSHML